MTYMGNRGAILRIWDELADFDAVQTAEASRHLLHSLSVLLNARNACWIAAVRTDDEENDPMRGWRIARTGYLIDDPVNEAVVRELRLRWARREVDALTRHTLKRSGECFRIFSLRQTMTAEWFESAGYKVFYEGRGVYDCIISSFPLSQDAECGIVIHASPERGAFSTDEIALTAEILRGLKWFLRRILHEHRLLIASSPLSPAERRTLTALLTGATEKEIGFSLDLSPHTVHQYAKSIYRKYGVKGRAGLMSLWLNRMP